MTRPFNLADFAKFFAMLRGLPIYHLRLGSVMQPLGRSSHIVLLRHDIDNDLQAAVEFARVEAAHDIRSTYFFLDGSLYWHDKHLVQTTIEAILYYGHEIGWHNNAIARSIREKREIPEIIESTLEFLRRPGAPVIGTASHGDPLCREFGFTNYEIWKECPKPTKWSQYNLADFGLEYEAYFLPRTHYISESGGIWRQDNEAIIKDFKEKGGTLQVLIHPQWWNLNG